MRFYLGAHMPHWLSFVDVPLFVSHLRMHERRRLPRAIAPWALDSGAFSDIALRGRFTSTPAEYAAAIRRYHDEIGQLDWAAPQDHMCEPWVLAKSEIASTVAGAQQWTVHNLLELRSLTDFPIPPVLQGQTVGDYLRHADAYRDAGIDLETEPLVGLGSVCRRQNTDDIGRVVAALDGLPLHGFGVKSQGLARYGWMLHSADSMAWSERGKHIRPCPVRPVVSCANCLHHALEWRERVIAARPDRPVQLVLEAAS